MIKILVDEGYAFDHLSITHVKLNLSHGAAKAKHSENYDEEVLNITNQIGEDKFRQIITSRCYADLYECNKKIFKLVDLAKKDQIKASEVDNANYERFVLKKTLQEKFFDSKVREMKMGYN